jgi:hypothetical protein
LETDGEEVARRWRGGGEEVETGDEERKEKVRRSRKRIGGGRTVAARGFGRPGVEEGWDRARWTGGRGREEEGTRDVEVGYHDYQKPQPVATGSSDDDARKRCH